MEQAPEQISAEQRKELEEKLKNMSPEEIADLQKQQCIFCQIIDGKIPSKKVYEDDQVLVILDIRPATKGHCLIIPKKHYGIMPQIPEKELSYLFLVSKAMSKIVLKSLHVDGTNIFVANGPAAGQRAPHFMIHLIPRKSGDNLFPLNEVPIESELQQKVGQAVKAGFNQLMGLPPEEEQTTLMEAKKVNEPKEAKEAEGAKDTKDESGDDSDNADEAEDLESALGGGSDSSDGDAGEDEDEDDSDDEEEKDDGDDEDDADEDEKSGGVDLDDIANLFK
jgi:histidine triad (HIT) family protein